MKLSWLENINSLPIRIGYAIAKRLAEDGAHVVISSRKQGNVDRAVRTLKDANLKVTGQVCHVGKKEDRDRLIESVSYRNLITSLMNNFPLSQ